GNRVRCAIGRSVIESEKRQCACSGVETAIGQVAYDAASKAVQNLFGKSRKTSHLDYNEATEALADDVDASAKQARSEAYAGSAAIIRADERQVQPHSRQRVDGSR
ncbi:transcriptional regulator, partial [Pseudomonas aeruginosa]|nr:transcriptional regulator [Pseudomonas aeruginosa]